MAFDPQGYLAQVDGQRVLIHRVDAVANHIADGGAVLDETGFFLSRANLGQLVGDAACSRQQEVTGPRCRVADAQSKESPFLALRRLGGGQPIFYDRDKRTVNELMHQFRRRVVRAGLFAFGASSQLEAGRDS